MIYDEFIKYQPILLLQNTEISNQEPRKHQQHKHHKLVNWFPLSFVPNLGNIQTGFIYTLYYGAKSF